MNIGYIGLGDMGGALATRLASRHPLYVFDLNPAAIERLVAASATPCPSVSALADASSTVLLCLPTSAHVRAVIFGDDGLRQHLAPGSLIIDQTSGDPSVTRQMALDLSASGIVMVDAPVSGGAEAALAGTISIMLGCSEEQLTRASVVLRQISENVIRVGPVGTGHTMKLVNNLLSCTQRLLSLEALVLAAKNGIEPGMAVDVLSVGGGRNGFLERQARRTLSGERDLGFSIALAHKDLKLACQLASESDMPMFYGSLSRDLYQVAASQLGGSSHVEQIAALMESLGDVDLTAPQV